MPPTCRRCLPPSIRMICTWLGCLGLTLSLAACSGIPILVQTAPSATPFILAEVQGEEPALNDTPTITVTASQLPTGLPLAEEPAPAPPDTPAPAATRTPRPSATLTITPGPSPTATRTPTRTPTATNTRRPTLTRTMTQTSTPHMAVVRISRPGLLSKVSSPFRVEAVAQTGEGGRAWLHLIGEDGRIITEQSLSYGRQENQRFIISQEVSFDITAAAEAGRLMISSRDSFGRTIGLSSVDLILMKTGRDELNPPAITWEPYIVRQPRTDTVVSGGVVAVSGIIRPVNDTPVIFELIDTAGRVVGAAETEISPPSGDYSHTPFRIGIPYQVSTSTPVRLVLRQQSDGRIPGTIALWSRVISLEP
jgi:hypothetical protein